MRIALKHLFVCLFLLTAGVFCRAQGHWTESQSHGDGLTMKINLVRTSSQADTVYADFRLLKGGRKVFKQSLLDQANRFRVWEKGSPEKYWPKVDTILDLRQKEDKYMSDNLSILLLIDRSATISDALLREQGEVVKMFINELQGPKLYIAFMENGMVTETMPVKDMEHYRNVIGTYFFTGDDREGGGEKYLFRSILSKLQELSGEPQTELTYREIKTLPDFKGNDGDKMLFVFTDGKVKDSLTYYSGDAHFLEEDCWSYFYESRFDSIRFGKMPNIPVHCVYVGDSNGLSPEDENMFRAICNTGREDDEKGHFYKIITPDSLQDLVSKTLDSLGADYCLVMHNPERWYNGSKLTLMVCMEDDNGDTLLSGAKDYIVGTPQYPVHVTGQTSGLGMLLFKGVLFGLMLVVAVYLLLQFLLPKWSYQRFLKKYVKPYESGVSNTVSQTCYFCKEPFSNGDMVVTKCQHVVHKECWDENRNRCPEYGLHKCSKGIHYYNQEKKSDPQNATRYLSWIMAGMLAGLLAWVAITLTKSTEWFSGMVSAITDKLYPFADGITDEERLEIGNYMFNKTHPWLLCGIFLGFFIVLAFSWVLEYRKKNLKVVLWQLARSAVGALAGFAAFLLGIVVVVCFGKESSCGYVDWIPWLLFSLLMSLVLWFKTEIKLSSALSGGSVAVILSFFIMFVLTGTVTSLFSYMLYAVGFGVSIAVVHFISEKYFLRIDGSVKERDIAIYKWMSVTGGFNKVSIGKSINCVLQMNWDDSENISDKAVELYLENERPYCRVLDHGVTRQGRSIPQGTVLPLLHGTEFTIGKTRFTYLEKDR